MHIFLNILLFDFVCTAEVTAGFFLNTYIEAVLLNCLFSFLYLFLYCYNVRYLC